MECMRRVDAGNISTEQWKSYSVILGVPSAPTIDGVFLPKHPDDLLKEGDFRNTTILIGTNQDEGTAIKILFNMPNIYIWIRIRTIYDVIDVS